jgi:hypothetical protein
MHVSLAFRRNVWETASINSAVKQRERQMNSSKLKSAQVELFKIESRLKYFTLHPEIRQQIECEAAYYRRMIAQLLETI